MGQSSGNLSLKISQACECGKKFAELFYEKLDKSRHTMGQLFHDSAVVVWNGNIINGKGNVLEFYGNLPAIDTTLICMDAQPVSTLVTGDTPSILVSCNGKMSFDKHTKCFNESFLLKAENNVWKIVTDTYRNY
ncbi:hypothetical protein RDWZM_008136 [Blomia tropicalis]|uniref:NTF2-related export protein n=1 Tax=Blomia tropicalis TaxID=40697 RepID=A0A9Q0M152_BLOTA|nr:hypothetical protein RDWZM_008136 [Blomia tropicalis]